MALLLFSSFQMKINDAIVEIPVPWIMENAHLLSIDGAIYPDELNGLPLISKALDQANISDLVVSNIRRTEVSQTISEKLDIAFPANATLVSLKRLKERGNLVHPHHPHPHPHRLRLRLRLPPHPTRRLSHLTLGTVLHRHTHTHTHTHTEKRVRERVIKTEKKREREYVCVYICVFLVSS